MRIFASFRNKGKPESDKIISKRNYGPRTVHSIGDVIIEKILLFGNTLVTGNHVIYEMTDFRA